MLFIYLDESGDLGFNLKNGRTTKHFVISILIVRGQDDNRKVIKAVNKTLKRKLNPKNKRIRHVEELKGTKTNLEIKKYFFSLIEGIDFEIHAVVVEKEAYTTRRRNQDQLYNHIASHVLNGIQIDDANCCVSLVIDKSKARPAILQFNKYVTNILKDKIKPAIPLKIDHSVSHNAPGLQAIDLFCHGIFENYERGRKEWYGTFSCKIKSLLLLRE